MRSGHDTVAAWRCVELRKCQWPWKQKATSTVQSNTLDLNGFGAFSALLETYGRHLDHGSPVNLKA